MTKHLPPEERRRQFLDATGRVFLREGLAGITMIAVSKEAGLSRRLLYDFFPDLRTLLRDYVLDALSRRLALVVGGAEQPPTGGPTDGLRDVMRAVLGFDDEQRAILELLRTPSPSPDLALVAETVRGNMLARWRAYPQLAALSPERLLALTKLMLSVALDLSDAVRSGALTEQEAEDAAVAVGTTTVGALTR